MEKTRLIPIWDPVKDLEGINMAGEILRNGGIVAIPTETVYGLAADAMNPDAVRAVYTAKGRPSDNPMIVHISDMEMLSEIVRQFPENGKKLADAFWPGPMTLVLQKTEKVPLQTTGGLDSVAVRMPSNEIARAIIRAAGTPLAAPSANRSGSPSPTTFQHCIDDLWDLVDGIVESDPCNIGVESTVISLCGETPIVLRPGAVTPEDIIRVCGNVEVSEAVLHMLPDDAAAPSPGMKYKHYSPEAELELVFGSREAYTNYVNEKANGEPNCYAMCFDEDVPLLEVPSINYGAAYDYETMARNLFDVLRQLDKLSASKVYVHAPDPEDEGLAVYNRLLRAAAFRVVKL